MCFALAEGFPGGSDSEKSAHNAGDPGSIPGLGRSSGEGNGNPLQCSCLENPMGGEAWWASLWDDTELDTTERLTFSLALAEGSCRSHPGTQVSGPG